jgi:transcriptional regulator with XRE-family HTH domain
MTARKLNARPGFAGQYDGRTEETLMKQAGRSCTVKDVAALAGVSTATVSRVVNGFDNVSREISLKVSRAISKVQYCPDPHAAEMGRKSRGQQRTRGGPSRAPDIASPEIHPGLPSGIRTRQARWGRLEEENFRLKRLVAGLSAHLEILKSLND